MKRFLALPIVALLCMGASCSERDNTQSLQMQSGAPRVTVAIIGTFEDRLAYGNQRSVYLITDTKTGREFIGISGVGISEVGDHASGKTRTRDER
jgi:hypothetical protein